MTAVMVALVQVYLFNMGGLFQMGSLPQHSAKGIGNEGPAPELHVAFSACAVDADYGHGIEEDYIDLRPILRNLLINPSRFLKPIENVEISYA